MLELWQTEWCPASRRVRQRLTELGIDYLIRQVPVEKEERAALRRATGSETIPALVFDNGEIAVGEDSILRLLPTPCPSLERRRPTDRRRRRPAAATSRRNANARNRLHTQHDQRARPRRRGRARPRGAEGRGLRSPLRDRRPSDPEGQTRRRRRSLRDPRRLQPAARPPGTRDRARTRTLLPCNVVVYRRDDTTHIAAIDAERMLSIVGNDQLAPTAAQVRDKLARVVDRAASV